jgi:hypothetical protein
VKRKKDEGNTRILITNHPNMMKRMKNTMKAPIFVIKREMSQKEMKLMSKKIARASINA